MASLAVYQLLRVCAGKPCTDQIEPGLCKASLFVKQGPKVKESTMRLKFFDCRCYRTSGACIFFLLTTPIHPCMLVVPKPLCQASGCFSTFVADFCGLGALIFLVKIMPGKWNCHHLPYWWCLFSTFLSFTQQSPYRPHFYRSILNVVACMCKHRMTYLEKVIEK